METVSSKVPTNLKEEIQNYADSRNISRSEAVRQLIRAGLDAQNPNIWITRTKNTALFVIGFLLVGSISTNTNTLPKEVWVWPGSFFFFFTTIFGILAVHEETKKRFPTLKERWKAFREP